MSTSMLVQASLNVVYHTQIGGGSFFSSSKNPSSRNTSTKKLIFASLGFVADPRVGIERACNGILKDVAGLLVYQNVFRCPPAQAFLKVIVALRRRDDEWKLLEAYGDFYNHMMAGRHPSWEDLILEGILAGEKNPFAEAAANVRNSSSRWYGGIPPSLQAAAAADLDSLQRLSITESTLVGWVADLVTDVRPEWRAAAEATLNSRAIKKGSYPLLEEKSDADTPSKPGNGAIGDESTKNLQMVDYQNELGGLKVYEHTDALASEREKLQKEIGGLWRWSEGLPLLERYYGRYSVGKLASAQVLQCQGGKLARDYNFCIRSDNYCELSIHDGVRQLLLENFKRHASGSAAKHVLVCGASGTGKTWLVKYMLRSLALKGEIRVVHTPKGELQYLNGLLEQLAKAWQIRFVVLVDDIFLKIGEDNLYILKSAINASIQECPANVMFCVTGQEVSLNQVKEEEPTPVNFDNILDTLSQMEAMDARKQLANNAESLQLEFLDDIFGTIVQLEKLDEKKFLKCVKEMVKHRKTNIDFLCNLTEDEIMQHAIQWGRRQDKLSVQAAAKFVGRFL